MNTILFFCLVFPIIILAYLFATIYISQIILNIIYRFYKFYGNKEQIISDLVGYFVLISLLFITYLVLDAFGIKFI